jgi:hypothetical protein
MNKDFIIIPIDKEFIDKYSLFYLNYIREKPCMICGTRAEPCHLRHVGRGARWTKPWVRHFTCVPMCRGHHDMWDNHQSDFLNHHEDPWRYAMQLFIEFVTGENFNR